MKRKFITPELKRIEVNLSNDVAALSYHNEDGMIFLSFYTWAIIEGVNSATCITYIKGGTSLADAQPLIESGIVTAHVQAGDYNAWVESGQAPYATLDNCMSHGWADAAIQPLLSIAGPSSSIY